MQKALNIWLEIYGENHPHVAVSYNNIGMVLIDFDKADEALEYHQKALKIRITLYGENHPGVAQTYNNIGSCLYASGKAQEAIDAYQKGLNILQLCDVNHPKIPMIYTDLGRIFKMIGNFCKALDACQKAYKIFLETYGEKHHQVAISLSNIGTIYRVLGETSRALSCFKQAILTFQAVFSDPNHPKIKACISNLEILKQEADKKSKQLVLKARDLQRKRNPQAVLSLYKEAFFILLVLHNEKLPMLSDSFLSLQIVQQIPIFELCGKYKDYSMS